MDIITNNFIRLGYTPEQVPERIAGLEKRMGKTLAEFTEGEARDTIKKMESQIAAQAEAPAAPTGEPPLEEAAE